MFIHFAHTTFNWTNEAKGKAAVHCVIVGFASFDIKSKELYVYDDIRSDPQLSLVKNINPYLVASSNIFIKKRSTPISLVPKMNKGSQPTDGGNLILSEIEKEELIENNRITSKYIKPLLSAHEFLNAKKRYCLWLVNANPSDLKKMPLVIQRINNVRKMRLRSSKVATQKWAEFPTLFTENRQPDSDYILVPSHSSERRSYIPIGFMTKNDILNNSCFAIPDSSVYEFGIISSKIHMTWVKYTCGRLKSDYRYSNTIVYNNYPWPKEPSEKNKKAVEAKAQNVLDVRAEFPDSSLADLYDPLTMPPKLVKAHQALDKAVDLCYRPQAFASDQARIEYLFGLYNEYTAPLISGKKGK
jgi:hypothetical protein